MHMFSDIEIWGYNLLNYLIIALFNLVIVKTIKVQLVCKPQEFFQQRGTSSIGLWFGWTSLTR